MKKGDVVKVKCEYLASDAKGVMKSPNGVFYIPLLLKDEEAQIKITEIKGNNHYGEIVELLKPSNERIKPNCPYYYKCGSCDLLHMSYDAEIKFKEQTLIGLFKSKFTSFIKMDNPTYYRKKAIVSFGVQHKKMVAGLYEEDSHKIIPSDNCLIQDKLANKIIASLIDIMRKQKIEAYSKESNQGTMRHALIRIGNNEAMVVLVTRDEIFPGRNNLLKELLKQNPEIKTVIQNINSRDTSIILGDKERILYGSGFIYDNLFDLKFKISPKSFYQINGSSVIKLYEEALNLADIKFSDTVFDAYSGIGTIALIASRKAKRVIGVEINPEATKDAITNMHINKINNVLFYNNDVEKFMENFNEEIDVLIIDPPRDGVSEGFIKAVNKILPKKIVYISCNPFTQKRDIELFSNYSLKKVIGVDMFPHTIHVESIVLLSLKTA